MDSLFGSIDLSLHQYHPLVLQQFLKSDGATSPSLFSFRVLGVLESLHSHMDFRINLPMSIRSLLKVWVELHWIYSIIQGELTSWQYWIFCPINNVYFPIISVSFNFSQEYFVVFNIQASHTLLFFKTMTFGKAHPDIL